VDWELFGAGSGVVVCFFEQDVCFALIQAKVVQMKNT
jgi:hypothetical protein